MNPAILLLPFSLLLWLAYAVIFIAALLLFVAAHVLAPRSHYYGSWPLVSLVALLLTFSCGRGSAAGDESVGTRAGPDGALPALLPAGLPPDGADYSDDEETVLEQDNTLPPDASERPEGGTDLQSVAATKNGLQVRSTFLAQAEGTGLPPLAYGAIGSLGTALGLVLVFRSNMRKFLGLPDEPAKTTIDGQPIRFKGEPEYVTREEFQELEKDVRKLTDTVDEAEKRLRDMIEEQFRTLSRERSVSVANLHQRINTTTDGLRADIQAVATRVAHMPQELFQMLSTARKL